MEKIIRLTEQDLSSMIKKSLANIMNEDVLGDNWQEREDDDGADSAAVRRGGERGGPCGV